MSDYSDVLYDPRSHTHDSCLKEVPGCDVVVLIIGSRFGGRAVPTALSDIDFPSLEKLSNRIGSLENKEHLSVTQLEVLKAVESAIPVYAFVDDKVLHDHHVYEKNKDKKDLIDQIEFPSIQKRETAKYIFEFINFLSHRVTNNSITGYSRLEDIRLHLTSQWSQLFQRLLIESRTKAQEARRYSDFSERIEDLKAVVLASVANPDLRATAKGAVSFRHIISFVSGLNFIDHRDLLLSNLEWDELLKKAGITAIRIVGPQEQRYREQVFLVREDRTFYRTRIPPGFLQDLGEDWGNFKKLELGAREAIVDALLENRDASRNSFLRYVEQSIDSYLESKEGEAQDATEDQFEIPVSSVLNKRLRPKLPLDGMIAALRS